MGLLLSPPGFVDVPRSRAFLRKETARLAEWLAIEQQVLLHSGGVSPRPVTPQNEELEYERDEHLENTHISEKRFDIVDVRE